MGTIDATQDTSDPVSYTCTCSAREEGGQILLFYRYWDNSPQLPADHSSKTEAPAPLAVFHEELASRLGLGGKFRIAREGFNITLGGTLPAITTYISSCLAHWSFAGIDLSTAEARNEYFKPTPGCACAFGGAANVRVTAEITPLGITNYAPEKWDNLVSLSPADFHKMCEEGEIPLIDVRNHYESRIGYFVTGRGDVAVRPQVRRFSQWPGYVARHVLGNEAFKKPIATYCTGGIRCEKGARWMQETLAAEGDRGDYPVYTLHGGIVAYQAWMQKEVEAGWKKPEDSFFKGKNYVFDARGAIAPDGGTEGKVATCHGCGKDEDRLGKCQRVGCHLVLVVCEPCEMEGGVACCEDCRRNVTMRHDEGSKARKLCRCESHREKSLWGDGGAKLGHSKPRQKTRGREVLVQ